MPFNKDLTPTDNRLNFELQENYCKGNISRLDFLDSMDYNESGLDKTVEV